MLSILKEFFGMLFWKTPIVGPNTVIVVEGKQDSLIPPDDPRTEHCGIHRYVLKDRLVFRPGISGINHRVYRATDPGTGAVIQIPHGIFHALFSPTKSIIDHE